MSLRPFPALALVALTLSACSGSPGTPDSGGSVAEDPIVVAASFYPIAEIVSRVGGDHVEVFNLTPPGTEAHEVEITAKQMERLNDASVSFYLGDDFQPNVQAAIATVKGASMDLLKSSQTITSVGSDEIDPHVWLDPENMVRMTRAVAGTLSELRPDLQPSFRANADAYIKDLESLGSTLDASLSRCTTRVLATAHRSFSYLAARAGLETNALLDYSGEDAATSKDIEAFADALRTMQVTTVFYEVSIARDSMKAVADLVGATTATLDPIETITQSELAAGATYLSIQRTNISRIAEGLECS